MNCAKSRNISYCVFRIEGLRNTQYEFKKPNPPTQNLNFYAKM